MSASTRNPVGPSSPETVLPSSVRPPAPRVAVAVRPSSCAVVCAVSGEVDLSTTPHLRDRLLGQIRLSGPDLVVDLGEVRFFGAAGLGVLVEVRAAAEASGVGFCVIARTRAVLLPLIVTGLDLVFTVYSDVDGVPARGGSPDRTSGQSAVVHRAEVKGDRPGR